MSCTNYFLVQKTGCRPHLATENVRRNLPKAVARPRSIFVVVQPLDLAHATCDSPGGEVEVRGNVVRDRHEKSSGSASTPEQIPQLRNQGCVLATNSEDSKNRYDDGQKIV